MRLRAQLPADFGEELEAREVIGVCVAARDGEDAAADGVEVDSVADFAGEAEEGGELLVAFGAVCVGTSSSESMGARVPYM